MPKTIASADLASIYGDPDRAAAEAERDLTAAKKLEDDLWASQARTGVFLGTLAINANRQANNADFKLKRAKAAKQIAAVSTSPILAGFSANQLKLVILGGVVVAFWLFFF